MSTGMAVYLRETNQTIVSVVEEVSSQGETALSLPEGAWVAGVLAVMALLLLVVSLVSKGKKVQRCGFISVCVE